MTGKIAEIQVKYNCNIDKKDRIQIKNANEAFNVFKENWSELIEYQEELNILLLNKKNEVLGVYNAFKGGGDVSLIDVKIILKAALSTNAFSIILAHNHPSGDTNPSRADIEVTKKIKKACDSLEIALLDHLILTNDIFLSMNDEGYIYN